MSSSFSRHVVCLLLYLFFHVEGVFGRGKKGGGKGRGKSSGGAATDLGLPPALDAIFAIAIIIALITAYQLQRSLGRFKRLKLPEGEPTLPYDVGMLFRVLLASYTTMYMVNQILYAIYIASFGDTFSLDPTFYIGVAFTGQLSLVLFYAIFLSIIAYRQRIQLNPGEKAFNLKSFLDGMLLAIILILGVAQDGIAGNRRSVKDTIVIGNLSIASAVVSFLASADVVVSSFMARSRLSKAGIHDKIINISAFAVSPIVLIGGIYGIINIGILRIVDRFFNYNAALSIAALVIKGLVSIGAITCAIFMGAPPKPPKAGKGGETVEKEV